MTALTTQRIRAIPITHTIPMSPIMAIPRKLKTPLLIAALPAVALTVTVPACSNT